MPLHARCERLYCALRQVNHPYGVVVSVCHVGFAFGCC
jgi:hypothetical protein